MSDLFLLYNESERPLSINRAYEIVNIGINEIKCGSPKLISQILHEANTISKESYENPTISETPPYSEHLNFDDINLLTVCLSQAIKTEIKFNKSKNKIYKQCTKKRKVLTIKNKYKEWALSFEQIQIPDTDEQIQEEKPTVTIDDKNPQEAMPINFDEQETPKNEDVINKEEIINNFQEVKKLNESTHSLIENYLKSVVIPDVSKIENLQKKIEQLQNEIVKLSDSAKEIGDNYKEILQNNTDGLEQIKQHIEKSFTFAEDVIIENTGKKTETGIKCLYDVYTHISRVLKTLPEEAQSERNNTKIYLEKILENARSSFNTDFFESEAGTKFDSRIHMCLSLDFDPDVATVAKSISCGIKTDGQVIEKELVQVIE